jgi:hypothetical protein
MASSVTTAQATTRSGSPTPFISIETSNAGTKTIDVTVTVKYGPNRKPRSLARVKLSLLDEAGTSTGDWTTAAATTPKGSIVHHVAGEGVPEGEAVGITDADGKVAFKVSNTVTDLAALFIECEGAHYKAPIQF